MVEEMLIFWCLCIHQTWCLWNLVIIFMSAWLLYGNIATCTSRLSITVH